MPELAVPELAAIRPTNAIGVVHRGSDFAASSGGGSHGTTRGLGTALSCGLGLIRMQERVRGMNGELAIDSKPGSGTIVTAFVPLSEGREQCAAQS
jgi:signal transduction histidine kinase